MNKEKDSAGVSQVNVPGVPQNASGVPVKRLRSSRRWIVIICIVVVVAVAAGVVVVTVTSPENIMRSYLRSKYGKDFVLVGEMRRERGSAQREHYYESDAYPIDDTRLRFRVVLDGDNKEHKYEKSDTYLEAGRVLAEEDRLQPYAERIFGKNTKVGVEFRLCERGAAGMKGMVGLPEAMSICKEETADMTKEEIIDSSLYNDSGLSHDYSVYIYALDGQTIKTDGDKVKIIERLKKMVKYLPDGRSDSMWLCYFIKQYKGSGWGSELKVSVDDLRQMTDSFSDDLLKPIVTNDGGTDPYPIRKGWDK